MKKKSAGRKKYNFLIILLLAFVFFAVFSSSFILATDCWQYTSTSNGCTSANGCVWRNDSWSTGWCEELNCWSLTSQTQCTTTNVPGKNCTWNAGGTTYGCERLSCWSLSGTSESSCESNTAGLNCEWSEYCYSNGGGSTNCWSNYNQTSCMNSTGCAWGQCMEKGCWSYSDSASCNAATDWNGKNCSWENNYCNQNGCWRYYNETDCTSVALGRGLSCAWRWNSCQEVDCYNWDFTNETACVNNSANLSCSWGGSYCNKQDCWSYNTQTLCQSKPNCLWRAYITSGWCNEVNCWNWDAWSGGSYEACDGNSTLYNLDCEWSIDPANSENGWCYKNMATMSCANKSTERECMDTFYCWWQYYDWNNVSAGGTCNEPGSFAAITSNDTIFNIWNPGCYIFDRNDTDCNSTLGCIYNYSRISCDLNLTHKYNATITNSGLNCTMINESRLCNNIPVLSSCCAWQNGTCAENKLSNACKDQIQQKAENSCEDAKTETRCNQIAGTPWYMPCAWLNSTSKCSFKSTDIFGVNGSQSITLINNKMSCKAAGGKWIIENYCEGNVSIPSGRCEYKFDEEDNCDKTCFACENKNSAGTTVNSTNAQSACIGSALGFCEYTADATAPNGIGYCKAKSQFKKGIAGDCGVNCGDCAFKGDPNSNDTTKRPSSYCGNSKANLEGGGCKWIVDNSTTIGGYCIKKGDKTCEDTCDRCKTQTNCVNLGRTAGNLTAGGCKWDGSTTTGTCVMNTDASAEICWDGVDNNNNNLIDCADASCYSDSFCGFVEGNCFGWTDNNTCVAQGCEWITDKWGSWCDFKGSQCWKYNVNSANCTGTIAIVNESLNISSARIEDDGINTSTTFTLSNTSAGWAIGSIIIINDSGTDLAGNFTINYTSLTITFSNNDFMTTIGNMTNVSYSYYTSYAQKNCQWTSGSGDGMCEQDWSKGEVCMGLSRDDCLAAFETSGCNWTADTWCSGSGNNTDWCLNNGGWCDYRLFQPKNCWAYSNSSSCGSASGCGWQTNIYSQPHCEVNWAANCWQYMSNLTCSEQTNCIWDVPIAGSGWCMNKADKCWNYYNQSDCASALGGRCYWQSWGSTGGTMTGSCQSICWNGSFNTQLACSADLGCLWKEDNGWCQESSSCWNFNQVGCQNETGATSGCRWKESGWCDPKEGGFSSATTSNGGGTVGGGGMGGGDCFRYDGNRSLCTNKTLTNISCGWTSNPTPACEVNWAANCWQYTSVEAGCNADNGCWFKNDTWSSYCTNIMDQCWSNETYQMWNNSAGWAGNCSANPLCTNNSWGGCEPSCFSQTTAETCIADELAGKCRWTTGWCNPGTMNEMFTGMEAGASAPIGMDICGAEGVSQASVDICGFGMKDMGDSYGFGAGVQDFGNASSCNKEKLSSFVMGMAETSGGGGGMPAGGSMTTFGTERTGSGNETIIYIVYLDTDGSTTGNCALDFNSSAVGYEFRFKYTSQWNASLSKAVETFNADKCDASNWKATDIKLSTWKKKMCSDIGGPMIAVKKEDLGRFPTLYDSTADLRIFIATIGNTGNISYPADIAGPGWITPGSVDFEIKSIFDYDAGTAQFEDLLRKGFVSGEDCFNSVDDDFDGNIDCNDWDCEYSSKCALTGVNAPGYVDTSSPLVTGVKIEEYTDAALIMYDTNKPTNGTLELYGYGDTQCLNKTNDIYDVGVLSPNVIDYKLWHTAAIYETDEVMGGKNVSINWPLVAGSTYNYKLRVCDSNGKCAVSKCSSFTTAATEQKCGYCNFVTRIKTPTGWSIKYDVNRDGTFDHIQGQVCGPNAGMKTNYTLGRKVNVRLYKDDGTTYIEFFNASLTKTALNDKVTTVSTSGDIIGSSNLVGLTSETRDKLINNLHPEVCQVKISTSGTCTTLYHCDDSGANCEDRTNSATLVDATNCVWQVPNCEFSTYKTNTPDGGSPGGGGGGGGGSAGVTTYNTTYYFVSSSQLDEGYAREIQAGEKFKFQIGSAMHYVTLHGISSSLATINISNQIMNFAVSDSRNFDVDADGTMDIIVTLNKINVVNKSYIKAEIAIKSISAGSSTLTGAAVTGTEDTITAGKKSGIGSAIGEIFKGGLFSGKKGMLVFAVIIAVTAVLLIVLLNYLMKYFAHHKIKKSVLAPEWAKKYVIFFGL